MTPKPELSKTEFGRFELLPSSFMPGCHMLLLECVDREQDFWLKVNCELAGNRSFVGFLRFRQLEPNTFELAEMRPAHGPIHTPPVSEEGPSNEPPSAEPVARVSAIATALIDKFGTLTGADVFKATVRINVDSET